MIDAVAREIGREASEVRLINLVPPEKMPYENVTKKHFDSGDYPECLRRAVAAIDLRAVRVRQKAAEPDGRRIGVGFSIFCEQAAHGTAVYAGWGIPMVPGYEQATAQLTPDGGLELRVGIQSHGQGLETTLAQVANEVLGVAIDRVTSRPWRHRVHAHSTGTWGSRCMVMAGGAVARACQEIAKRVLAIGAKMLQTDIGRVSCATARSSDPRAASASRR